MTNKNMTDCFPSGSGLFSAARPKTTGTASGRGPAVAIFSFYLNTLPEIRPLKPNQRPWPSAARLESIQGCL